MPVTGSKSISNNLSIRVKADGFSFLVTEGHSGDILHTQEFSLSSQQVLHEELALQLNAILGGEWKFTRVRVIIYGDSTYIPQQEFVADRLEQLYSVVFPAIDGSSQEVCFTHLPQLDIVVAFAMPMAVRKVVEAVCPEATFTSASAVILGRVATICKRQQLPDNALFAYVTPLQLFLFSVSQDKLKFANNFELDQPKDSLFYLLSVWKSLERDARRHYCYVAGETESMNYLAEALVPYLQNVEKLSISIEY